MTTIHSPNPDYSGTYTWGDGTVTTFENGKAELDGDLPAGIRSYLQSAGYGIDKPAASPADPVIPPDPRDGLTDQVGSRLRDAAVDPHDTDFLAPSNAGKEGPEGNPHGPNVVNPEIHASVGQAIAPGPVLPGAEQEPKERELSDRTRIDQEPVPEVVADLAVANPDHEPEAGEPKGNASRDEWAKFAKTKGAPDEELAQDGTGLSRDDLRARYGS